MTKCSAGKGEVSLNFEAKNRQVAATSWNLVLLMFVVTLITLREFKSLTLKKD